MVVGGEVMKDWLSIVELAEKTSIPDTTIRRYISKFPDFFIHKGGSRSKRYEDTAIKVLVRIKNLFDEGYETDLVESKLKNEFALIIDDNRRAEKNDTAVLATAADLLEIKEALAEQKEFNKLLIEKLSIQETYIKESLEKRDRLLMESLRIIQEDKKAQAEVAAAYKKPGFFQRIFGGTK
jgi:DNA-binding transcriptional MerR regulator